MINFDEFANELMDAINAIFEDEGAGKTVEIREITKNNNVTLKGLTIHEENSNVSPNIYLEGFYKDYLAGASLDTIADKVIGIFESNKAPKEMQGIADMLCNFDCVKDSIVTRLVNTERNGEALVNMPHSEFLDLTVVYCVNLESVNGGVSGSVKVTNDLMSHWGITIEELDAIARKNDIINCQYYYQSLDEFIMKMMMNSGLSEEEAAEYIEQCGSPVPFNILRNKDSIYGATALLHSEILERFSDECGGDLYIIPSSVHELLVLPVDTSHPVEEYQYLIEEVNENEVSEEEFLSNSLYLYSRDAKEVSIAA